MKLNVRVYLNQVIVCENKQCFCHFKKFKLINFSCLHQVDALLAKYHSPNDDAPNVDEQVNEVLKQLSEKIDTAINKYGEAGAFIKLNTHSPKDAVLDKNEPEYVQELQVKL